MNPGYWSIARIAARWDVDEDTARAWLADCERMKVRRAVRYAIEGVLAIEQSAMFRPAEVKRPPRAARAQAAMSARERELRQHFGLDVTAVRGAR